MLGLTLEHPFLVAVSQLVAGQPFVYCSTLHYPRCRINAQIF